MTDLQLPERLESSTRTDCNVTQSHEARGRNDPGVLCDRLSAQHPEVDPTVVRRLVQDAWDESSRFRLKDFRMVLVERAVQNRFRALRTGTT